MKRIYEKKVKWIKHQRWRWENTCAGINELFSLELNETELQECNHLHSLNELGKKNRCLICAFKRRGSVVLGTFFVHLNCHNGYGSFDNIYFLSSSSTCALQLISLDITHYRLSFFLDSQSKLCFGVNEPKKDQFWVQKINVMQNQKEEKQRASDILKIVKSSCETS